MATLDREESARSPYFDAQFSRFDRDADAKVFEEEMLACAEGEILIALSRTSVAVDNRGQDLFEILDTAATGASRGANCWNRSSDFPCGTPTPTNNWPPTRCRSCTSCGSSEAPPRCQL